MKKEQKEKKGKPQQEPQQEPSCCAGDPLTSDGRCRHCGDKL